MKRFIPIIFLLFFALPAQAQLWSGLIDPSRATDWSTAGVIGGIPSGSWTQCGPTIAAYNGTADTIINAVNYTSVGYTGCTANQYILLGPGTFNLTTAIRINQKNRRALRGSGAKNTILAFASGAVNSCGGQFHTPVCIYGVNGSEWYITDSKFADWTGGLTQGSTIVTLSNTTNLVANQSLLLLDKCPDGVSGFPCSPGVSGTYITTEQDTGNLFDFNGKYVQPWSSVYSYSTSVTNSATFSGRLFTSQINSNLNHAPTVGGDANWTDLAAAPNGTFGGASNGPDQGNQRLFRGQAEVFQISNVGSGGTAGQVTLVGSIRGPNYTSGTTPAAAVAVNPINYFGLENLTIDVTLTGDNDGPVCIYCSNSWMSGLRVLNPGYSGFLLILGSHNTIQNSYRFGSNRTPGVDSFTFNTQASSDILIQNNISQGGSNCLVNEGSDSGLVFAYNLCLNQRTNNGNLSPCIQPHARNMFQLFEGNICNVAYLESLHGPKTMVTLFRNFFTGWESCANNGVCGAQSFKGGGGSQNTPARTAYGSRYNNAIANVLGTPSYAAGYTGGLLADGNIYGFGSSGAQLATDALITSTFYRYGNVDAVTGFAFPLYCLDANSTNWNKCPGGSEVPTGISPYGQPAPTVGDTTRSGGAQSAFPASLYLSGRPSAWWPVSIPWPAIGPDVTGGNVGQCNGTFGPTTPNVAGQYGGVAALNSGHCPGTSFNSAALGGRVNAIPAMLCALNVMGMPVDGTNSSALPFDANDCYSGATAPLVTLTTFPANFGSHTVGVASGSQTFTLTNSGTSTLTYSLISVTGANISDFALTPGVTNPCTLAGSTLAAGGNCTFKVIFTPSNTGTRTANLQVDSNAASTPDLGAMSGIGQASVIGTGANFSLTKMIWKNNKTGVLTAMSCRVCGTNCFGCFKPGSVNPSPKILLW